MQFLIKDIFLQILLLQQLYKIQGNANIVKCERGLRIYRCKFMGYSVYPLFHSFRHWQVMRTIHSFFPLLFSTRLCDVGTAVELFPLLPLQWQWTSMLHCCYYWLMIWYMETSRVYSEMFASSLSCYTKAGCYIKIVISNCRLLSGTCHCGT